MWWLIALLAAAALAAAAAAAAAKNAQWKAPATPPLADRWVNTTMVHSSTPMAWPATHANLRLDTAALKPDVWQGSMAGIPIQRVLPNAPTTVWTENNTYMGTIRQVQLPLPESGEYWVEGDPNGAWDKHWLGVCPETHTAWEVIRMDKNTKTFLAMAIYVNGVLQGGSMHVCAGQLSMTGILMNNEDKPHRLGLAMNNYAGWDGTESWTFPRCGDVVRLPKAKAEAMIAANQYMSKQELNTIISLSDYGAVIYDKTGSVTPMVRLGMFGGSQWVGSTLGNLNIRVGDLELVTS